MTKGVIIPLRLAIMRTDPPPVDWFVDRFIWDELVREAAVLREAAKLSPPRILPDAPMVAFIGTTVIKVREIDGRR